MIKYYPTKQHEEASKQLVNFFSKDKTVMSMLLFCSCARGKAIKDSCLDICIIVKDKKQISNIHKKFRKFEENQVVVDLKKIGLYSHIDLLVTDAKVVETQRDWTSGPDEFELELGNIFNYSVVLFDHKNYFKNLQKKWIPYYSESLRKKRLEKVIMYCLNNLGHVEPYVKRGLYFQAFDRLYGANQEFMQALFIKKKTYPISYDKWIKEQFVDILKMPKLYKQFVDNIQIKNLESDELISKAKNLIKLVNQHLK